MADRKGIIIALLGIPLLIWFSEEPIAILAMYALGSIPVGYLVLYGRSKHGMDGIVLIGVSNAFRIGGNVAGILTLSGEISKVLAPLVLAYFIGGGLPLTIMLLMASVLGTCYSPWLGFSGGVGTTIFMWSMLILTPLSFGILLVSMFILLKTIRFTPKTALVMLILIPAIILLVDGRLEILIYSLFYISLFLINRRRWMYELDKAGTHLTQNRHFLTR